MIIYCLSYAHDIMIWITRSSNLHSDNIITTTTTTTASHLNTFVGSTCALPSALLVCMYVFGRRWQRSTWKCARW